MMTSIVRLSSNRSQARTNQKCENNLGYYITAGSINFTVVYCESVNLIGYIIVCYLLLYNNISKLFSHFDWFLPMIYWTTDARLTSSLQNFCLCRFKMAESFENQDNILRDWAKDKGTKKSCQGIERVREARKRKVKPFLLENDTEIIFQQPQSAVERD